MNINDFNNAVSDMDEALLGPVLDARAAKRKTVIKKRGILIGAAAAAALLIALFAVPMLKKAADSGEYSAHTGVDTPSLSAVPSAIPDGTAVPSAANPAEVTKPPEVTSSPEPAYLPEISVRLLSAGNGIPSDKLEGLFGGDVDLTDRWGQSPFDYAYAARELTVDFEGVSYKGSYVESVYNYNSSVSDIYVCTDGTRFGINGVYGYFNYLDLLTSEFEAAEAALEGVPAKQREAEARRIAGMYIDPSLCAVSKKYTPSEYGFPGLTQYTFMREAEGIPTTVYVTVTVTDAGHIARLHVGDLEAWDRIETYALKYAANGYDIASIIDEALAALGGSFELSLSSAEETRLRWAVTPDLRAVLCVSAPVIIRDGETEFSTLLVFTVSDIPLGEDHEDVISALVKRAKAQLSGSSFETADSRGLYETAWDCANAEQKERLGNIGKRYCKDGESAGWRDAYIREIYEIMGLLPENTPRLTLYAARELLESNEVYSTNEAAELFCQVAGCPDYAGGSGILSVVFYCDESFTSSIVLRWGQVVYVDETGASTVLWELTDSF